MPKGYWKWDPGGIGWFWRILDKIGGFLGILSGGDVRLRTVRSLVSQEVTGTFVMYQGYDPVPFQYKLDEELSCVLHVRVRLKLQLTTPSDEYYPWDAAALARLEEQKTNWSEAIRQYWSNQYIIQQAGYSGPPQIADQYRHPCISYSVLCDVEYVDSGEHYVVEISRLEGGENNAAHLGLEAHPKTAAHEYGHWTGQPHDDGESIMNGAEPSMKVWKRHYERFAEVLSTATGLPYTVE